jgi:2-haloalkanoic acid dehalogenase type II
LSARPRAIAFDCYGTLLDVTDESFVRACEGILAQHAIEHDSRAFWQTWLAASRALSVEGGRDPENPLAGPEPPFGSFRERWPRTFARAFQDVGVSADTLAAYQAFHNTLSQAAAYPDTRPALDRLRAHFRLAVVSNADDDHLHHALAENGLTFEFIISSESAQSYKPRLPIFQQAVERFGLAPHEVCYVGDSPLMDVLGARNAGLPVAWINRHGATWPERLDPADVEVHDLAELVDILLALPV